MHKFVGVRTDHREESCYSLSLSYVVGGDMLMEAGSIYGGQSPESGLNASTDPTAPILTVMLVTSSGCMDPRSDPRRQCKVLEFLAKHHKDFYWIQ